MNYYRITEKITQPGVPVMMRRRVIEVVGTYMKPKVGDSEMSANQVIEIVHVADSDIPPSEARQFTWVPMPDPDK